jgi:TM2 domain-containing membrane protein YozV
VNPRPKDLAIAYVAAVLLGVFAIHRFYLGRYATATLMLVMWVFGWFTSGAVIGVPILIAAGVWLIIDLVRMPRLVREANAENIAVSGTPASKG